MIFISAQPCDLYFLWQSEVQIVNFSKFGVAKDMHILVWYPREREKELIPWRALQRKYPKVKIFFYPDDGVDLSLYIPQLRPHILKKHFSNIDLSKDIIFYHDSDIIFNYLPDFNKLCEDDINWQSDCSGYLDYTYLRGKEMQGKIPENEAVKVLCDIGGISVDTLRSYDRNTGGAQCILKGIDSQFWEDIEQQVIAIRKAFYYGIPDSINKKYFANEAAGFQSWCADMWALNMALWKRGKITRTTSLLDFSWATDTYETFLKKPIYHNAGATKQRPELFYKGGWTNKSPIGKALKVAKGTASEQYVKAICEVK